MLDQELKDKIELFLEPDYCEVVENECELWEWQDTGRSKLTVHLPAEVSILCIRDHDNKPRCGFLNQATQYGLKKSVDHIILIQNPNGTWTANLIEMKSNVRDSVWQKISLKARATMLNMKALAAVLGITIDSFKVYTTYERLNFSADDPTDLFSRKPKFGGGWKENEWDKNHLPYYATQTQIQSFYHNGIKMAREDIDGQSTLCGVLALT